MANSVTGSPKRFNVDDRTMLCEIHEKVCGLTMLVEVAWEDHQVLWGPGSNGRHTSSVCEIARVRCPMRHDGAGSEVGR